MNMVLVREYPRPELLFFFSFLVKSAVYLQLANGKIHGIDPEV